MTTLTRVAMTIALFVTMTGAGVARAGAQTPVNAPRDTTPKTPQQRMLEKLRGLRPIGAPDSVPIPDSTQRAQPQNLQVNGRSPLGTIPLGGLGGQGGGRNGVQTPARIERDSIWQQLLKLNGFNATEYKSDTATFKASDNNLQLNGNALVSRDGQLVEAGRITYADSISLVCGYGRPRISGSGTASPVESDSLCYDVQKRFGIATGATTSISEGANWQLYSLTAYTRGDTVYGLGNKFTDCDLPWGEKHYAFEAKRVMASRGNMLVARDVTLRFKDVPVFWLPFMVQSLSQGRRSGILMPRFGVNDIARTSTRYSRRIEDVGFYWAMSDYMGSEIAFDWMSNNWTALRGSYDYNFLRQFVRGGLTMRKFWKEEGGTELTVASQNSWEPNERTRMNADVNFASASSFVRSRTFDPRELNRSIDSNFSMNRRLNFGSLTLGASRRQYLTDNTVNQVLPNASFNLSPLTFFSALPGEEHWYSNATWTGSVNTRREATLIDDTTNTNPSAQTRHQNSSGLRSSFQLGQLGITQNYSTDNAHADKRELPSTVADSTILLAATAQRRDSWDIGINYQKNIIGTTSITPRLTLGGESLNNEKTGNKLISAPVRLNFGTSLHADAYGIYDVGVGPFEKFRHKFSPSIDYQYSPKPHADSLQSAVFSGLGSTLEQNRISVTFAQTFEAKYREKRDAAQLRADSASADTASGPKRLQQATTITLLSINTSAVAYDFVQAREFNSGIVAPELNNNFHSDLLRGFTVDITHDLFATTPRADGGVPTIADRKFSPHLSRATASLEITGSSWLFRVLRLGRRDSMPVRPGELGASPLARPAEGGTPADRTQNEFGLVGTRNRYAQSPTTGATGAWTASLHYVLVRPRAVENVVPNNSLYQAIGQDQTLNGTLSFQPTQNWTASWETSYSVTAHAFNNQYLRLTRRLHDWDANFNFVKAQNGNFSFNFSVALRANPDIKLDWSQNEGNAFNTSRVR